MSHNTTISIGSIRHPFWRNKIADWTKWRLVYDGGPDFVEAYLEHYTTREEKKDFERRKRVSPTPNFAKAAVNDIKNAIFQRLVDVTRIGGHDTYMNAVQGEDFGVDLHGSSMNSFIGRELLPELLTMARVGVFVDMPPINGTTLKDAIGKRPYLYFYRAEDILSWSFRPGRPDEFDNLLVRDYVELRHAVTGLPSGSYERFRFMFIDPEDEKVHVRFFKTIPNPEPEGQVSEIQIDEFGNPTAEDIILDFGIIPFVMMELSDSLLADTANHQIALLNMESSDVMYALLSNFPFYTEQQDDRDFSHFKAPAGQGGDDGTAATAGAPREKEIQVGATHGRAYGQNMERPKFIHPSPEPLKASMEKQEKLKQDIRQLVNIALTNIKPRMASAESKAMDQHGLEAGLSYIGLVLEHSERKIAKYWAMYLSAEPGSINYPERYSLKSSAERRKDTEQLAELRSKVPSPQFQKLITCQMAQILIGHEVPNSIMDAIRKEIKAAKSFSGEPDTVFEAVERGILDLESAAVLLGYPPEVAKAAAKDHTDRLARIAIAQQHKPHSHSHEHNSDDPLAHDPENQGARGLSDLDGAPQQNAKQEKADAADSTTDAVVSDSGRGKARGTTE